MRAKCANKGCAVIAAAALAAGCGAKTGLDIEERTGRTVPIAIVGCQEVRHDVAPPAHVPWVDVLFVIDSSRSMVEEQIALGEAFPAMAIALASGDLDGDGELDFPPAELHVGVVTTDLGLLVDDGVDPATPASCFRGPVFGDDGLLQTGGAAGECEVSDDYFLAHMVDDAPDALAEPFACLARVGTEGCGFEQPLEAALKALTPATSALRFAGAPGHGDGLNAGFLRADSILAVIVLSDEDDQSLADGSWVHEEDDEALALGDAWLHPLARYLDGFGALRPEHPERLVFAAIAGLPLDLAPADATRAADWEQVLADPRMERRFDPGEEGVLITPSCVVPDRGRAYPPVRLTRFAAGLGDRALVQSICQADLRPALSVITARLGELVRTTYCADGVEGDP